MQILNYFQTLTNIDKRDDLSPTKVKMIQTTYKQR